MNIFQNTLNGGQVEIEAFIHIHALSFNNGKGYQYNGQNGAK